MLNQWNYLLCVLLIPKHETVEFIGEKYSDDDDNGCMGVLPPPCACDETTVNCVNSTFPDTDIFLNLGVHFPYLEKVAFQGNSFRQLPEALFGYSDRPIHTRLTYLNLSRNSIVEIAEEFFVGMESLEIVDLSDNKIVLQALDTQLLAPLSKLRQLYLRKAFARPDEKDENISNLQALDLMLKAAKLPHLNLIDLSWNFLTKMPKNFGCTLPKLRRLNLAHNYLTDLNLNTSCFTHLHSLDLSGNRIHRIGMNFRLSAIQLPNYSIHLYKNPFFCDCDSHSYISWVRSSLKIMDKEELVCHKTSPSKFKDVSLINVPLEKLDCKLVLKPEDSFKSVQESNSIRNIANALGLIFPLCLTAVTLIK